jgi:hypothetical protein
VTEILTVAGPLTAERLEWVSHLYGRADPKYRRADVLEHLFTRTREPSLHAFAVEEGRAVGHCCVVRTPGRLGADPLRAGKLEALFVEETHRGRRDGEKPVVRQLLGQLYSFADEQGVEVIHALATHQIGRVIRFEPVEGVGERTWVAATSGATPASTVLAAGQRLLRELEAAGTASTYELRAPDADDVDLVDASPAPPGCWTVLPADAWEWYSASPLLRVLEVGGGRRSRALVQIPGSPHEPFRLVGWRPERGGARAATALLRAAGRAARAAGAPTFRFQPWPSAAADGGLARACRLTGFVRRPDLTTIWVRSARPELARPDAVVSTPSLYLAF